MKVQVYTALILFYTNIEDSSAESDIDSDEIEGYNKCFSILFIFIIFISQKNSFICWESDKY